RPWFPNRAARARSDGSIPPALAPHLLADRARDARLIGLRRNDTLLRRMTGDFEHQLGADRLLELLAIVDGNDEGARPADHAILVVDIKVLDIEGKDVGPLHHDRQSIDSDAGVEHIVANLHDERPAIVGAVARYVYDAPNAVVAARIEQRLGK